MTNLEIVIWQLQKFLRTSPYVCVYWTYNQKLQHKHLLIDDLIKWFKQAQIDYEADVIVSLDGKYRPLKVNFQEVDQRTLQAQHLTIYPRTHCESK